MDIFPCNRAVTNGKHKTLLTNNILVSREKSKEKILSLSESLSEEDLQSKFDKNESARKRRLAVSMYQLHKCSTCRA